MFRSTSFSLKVAALATAVVLVFAGESMAQRGGHGGGGGHGGFGGGGGRGGFGGGRGGFGRGFGGWGGGFGGWGYGGLGYGGYGWGYPGWGYGGGYYDSGYYAPTYGTVPYYYGDGYTPSMASGTPISSYQSFYPPDGNYGGYGQPSNNTAAIDIKVPANAKVWFNDKETSQTGSDRHFVTPALEPGKTFTYEVRATWTGSDGQQVTRTREVHVQANQPTMVNFMANQNESR
jgi:uncharacterized protein (TIGR03000 family)